MNSKDFKSGDILQATQRETKKGHHPIVFVSGHSEYDFIGAMITHEAIVDRNVKMNEVHFQTGFAITFDNTYLVKGQFIKPEEWGPFNKIGQLTKEGLEFVIQEIADCPIETFAKYFARQAK
jgi:hypothetical protein